MNQLGIIDAPQFDYVVPVNPTIAVNPKKRFATWLNNVSGELFICLDAATGNNVWKGQMGTSVPV